MRKSRKLACLLLAGLLTATCSACHKAAAPNEQPELPCVTEITVAVGEIVDLPIAPAGFTVADPSIATCNGEAVIGFQPGKTTIKADDGKTVYNVTVRPNELGTTHVYDVRETEIPLVKNGKSEYVVVIPKAETDEMIVETAPQELNLFFAEATGCTLPVLTDDQVALHASGSYIFIGNTRQTQAAVEVDRALLGENGFRMVTVGNAVYLAGGGRFGTLYAVYEFLTRQFHFDQYSISGYGIDKNVTDCMLLDYNIVDVPDFKWRMANYYGWNVPMENVVVNRMRLHRTGDVWINFGGEFVHNALLGISPDKYRAEHPDWFSPDQSWLQQLCLTRDVEGLSDEVVAIMQELIVANPHLSSISFTQMDTPYWCDCPSCSAMKREYGTDAASNIKFINVVAKKLRPWLQANYPDRDMRIAIFAYLAVEDAPAVLNAETGEYEPMDESVVLDPMVTIFYAPIFAKYYVECDHPSNKRLDTNMKKWKALADSMYLWTYSTSFGYYFQPMDSFNSMQERFLYAYRYRAEYLFDQGQHNQKNPTDWGALKAYVTANMMWNIQSDMDALVDRFIEGYYLDAAAAMRAYYDDYRDWTAYYMDAYGYYGDCGDVKINARCFPETILNRWSGHIDDAYAAIEAYKKTDPKLYQTLYDRINIESISIRFMKMMIYGRSFTADGLRTEYDRFMQDCVRLGVSHYNEWNGIEMFYSVLHDRYPDMI